MMIVNPLRALINDGFVSQGGSNVAVGTRPVSALRGRWNRIEGWNNGDTEIRSDVYTRRWTLSSKG